MRLGPLEQAFPEKPSRAYGDFRLDDVPARPQGIALRVKQSEHPLALIIPHDHPEPRQGREAKQPRKQHPTPEQPRQQEYRKARRRHQNGGPQIGLEANEQRGGCNERQHPGHGLTRGWQGPIS